MDAEHEMVCERCECAVMGDDWGQCLRDHLCDIIHQNGTFEAETTAERFHTATKVVVDRLFELDPVGIIVGFDARHGFSYVTSRGQRCRTCYCLVVTSEELQLFASIIDDFEHYVKGGVVSQESLATLQSDRDVILRTRWHQINSNMAHQCSVRYFLGHEVVEDELEEDGIADSNSKDEEPAVDH